jgi:hypothetical protein
MSRNERLIEIIVEKKARKDVKNAEVIGQDVDGRFVIEFDGNPNKRRKMKDPGIGLSVGQWVSVLLPDGDINRAQIVGTADVYLGTIENAWG